MKRLILITLMITGSTFVSIVPANAGTYCADGTYSSSFGSGTCSWHGGILGGAPSKTKSYGSTLNSDPYGLNSYGSTKVKPYGGFGSGAPSKSQMDTCAKSAASMYKCATGR